MSLVTDLVLIALVLPGLFRGRRAAFYLYAVSCVVVCPGLVAWLGWEWGAAACLPGVPAFTTLASRQRRSLRPGGLGWEGLAGFVLVCVSLGVGAILALVPANDSPSEWTWSSGRAKTTQ